MNEEEGVPEVGRFNAGQKFVFWSMALLVPGAVLHRPRDLGSLFRPTRRSRQQRIAVLIHCLAIGGDHHLDHPCLCGDLGPRLGPRDDAGLCDARAGPGGIIASGCAVWWRPARSGRGRGRRRGDRRMRQGEVAPKGKWTGNPQGGVKAPEA